jgi:hypothetical protein
MPHLVIGHHLSSSVQPDNIERIMLYNLGTKKSQKENCARELALVNLMLSDQLFENKLIDVYLITTNNTSESVYGYVNKQLPPLMVFVKSANGVRPSLFCIGSIMMKLNTKLIPSFNKKLISSGRS